MKTKKIVVLLALFLVVLLVGCDFFIPYDNTEYNPPAGFTRFVSQFPADSRDDPICASYVYNNGIIYTDVADGSTLMLRTASSANDFISPTSTGTVMSDTNGYSLNYGSSPYVAFCYWGKDNDITSYNPTQCKKGVINVAPNASLPPYFEYSGSRVLGSVNIQEGGKIKIRASTAGATVYGIWKFGANSSNIPTQAEWDSCLFKGQDSLEMAISFNGSSYGVLFAKEKDPDKQLSSENTQIAVYLNGSVATKYTLPLQFISNVLGQRTYYTYLASLASASYTANRTGIYSNQNINSVYIPDGWYAINARSDPDGAWAFPAVGNGNFSVYVGGVKITNKGPSGDGFFTVKNGTVSDGLIPLD